MFPIPTLESLRTVEEMATAINDMQARITEMNTEAGVQPLEEDARTEWAALQDAIKAFKGAKEEAEERRRVVESFAAIPKAREEHRSLVTPARSRLPEDLHDLAEYRQRTSSQDGMVALMRDGARKIADTVRFPHPAVDHDKAVAKIGRLIEEAGDDPYFSNLFIATSSPTYTRGFAKIATGQADMLTPSERAAIATVGAGNLAAGGYMVPVILDPAIIPTSDGALNPLRGMARVETITGAGNTWNGVTSAGITLTRGPAEGSAITENTISFGQPTVTVQPVKGEIKFSVESAEDQPRLLSELAVVIQDAKDMEEADSFVNGVGTTVYPEGVVAGLAATSDVGTTGDGFDLTDVTTLIGRLPDRFEPRAQFLAHRAFYGAYEDLQAALGGTSVSDLNRGQQPTLKGYPRFNTSAMDSDVTGSGNDVLLFGDFKAGFLIVDKVGLAIQDAGFVRDGNGALTGQRALFIHYRNSSVILVDNAFRLLKIGVVTTGI
jgi:HK97 family phage major capsid protein